MLQESIVTYISLLSKDVTSIKLCKLFLIDTRLSLSTCLQYLDCLRENRMQHHQAEDYHKDRRITRMRMRIYSFPNNINRLSIQSTTLNPILDIRQQILWWELRLEFEFPPCSGFVITLRYECIYELDGTVG